MNSKFILMDSILMRGQFKIAFTNDDLLNKFSCKVYPKLTTEPLKKDFGSS